MIATTACLFAGHQVTHTKAGENWSGGGEEITDEPASAEVSLRPLMGEGT